MLAPATLKDVIPHQRTAKVAVLTAMIVLINTAWLLAGASLASVLRDPRRARIVNILLAVVLVAAAVAALL